MTDQPNDRKPDTDHKSSHEQPLRPPLAQPITPAKAQFIDPELQIPEASEPINMDMLRDIDLDRPQPDAPEHTPQTGKTVEAYMEGFEKKDILSFLFARRSVRKFLPKPVEIDYLEMLLMAAMSAPSANNKRPWEFIVADRPEDVKRIRGALVFGRYDAPAAIVVCGNLKKALPLQAKEYWVQDCAAAMQSLLLAAAGIGLGAVWVGVYPLSINMALLRKALQMPDHIIPLGVAYVGYPVETPPPRTQYDPECVHWISDGVVREGEERQLPRSVPLQGTPKRRRKDR